MKLKEFEDYDHHNLPGAIEFAEGLPLLRTKDFERKEGDKTYTRFLTIQGNSFYFEESVILESDPLFFSNSFLLIENIGHDNAKAIAEGLSDESIWKFSGFTLLV